MDKITALKRDVCGKGKSIRRGLSTRNNGRVGLESGKAHSSRIRLFTDMFVNCGLQSFYVLRTEVSSP